MEIFIIGTGKMAEAMIAGLSKAYSVTVVGRDRSKCEALSKRYHTQVASLEASPLDISGKDLVLAVKPYALDEVSTKLKGKANSLISVLAGTKLEHLRSQIDARHYVRAMPNLAATYGKSMTTLTGDESFKDEALKICSTFGKVLWLNSETEIDIATAVAGSGPAFLALVAEALSDGAVKEGLKREDANLLVKGLFEGFSPLIEDKHPALLKDEVMSPGGTTAAGYKALEANGVRKGFIEAIEKAYQRAKGS